MSGLPTRLGDWGSRVQISALRPMPAMPLTAFLDAAVPASAGRRSAPSPDSSMRRRYRATCAQLEHAGAAEDTAQIVGSLVLHLELRRHARVEQHETRRAGRRAGLDRQVLGGKGRTGRSARGGRGLSAPSCRPTSCQVDPDSRPWSPAWRRRSSCTVVEQTPSAITVEGRTDERDRRIGRDLWRQALCRICSLPRLIAKH